MRIVCNVCFRYVAPPADVSITQFNKIDWAFVFVVPPVAGYLAALPINHHKRPRSQQGIHCVVLKANVGIHILPRIVFEKERRRNLTPQCNNAIDELRVLPFESWIESHRNRHFCVEIAKLGRNGPRCRQPNFRTVSMSSIRGYYVPGQNLMEGESIDRSESECLEQTWYCVIVFDLCQPRCRNIEPFGPFFGGDF